MKLSVCLLFLGCLALAAAALPADREKDLQELLTDLEDLVDGLEDPHGMKKREEACGPATFTHIPQKDCRGRDIRMFPNFSLQECVDACCADMNCRSFQYRGRLCWLKNYRCRPDEQASFSIGNLYQRRM